MADDPKHPAFDPNDPLGRPLFGPTRTATPEEMALAEGQGPGDEGEEDEEDSEDDGEEASQPSSAAAAPPPALDTSPAPAPASDALPNAAGAPGAGAGEGGGAVIPLRQPAPAAAEEPVDLPKLVLDHFTARNAKTTGESYAGHLRRFLVWCAARGHDLKTMPPDTAMVYLTEAYPNPVSRNQGIVALRSSFEVANLKGVPFSQQEMVKTVRPSPKREPKGRTAAEAAADVTPRGTPLTTEVSEPIPPREAIARATATESATIPRATPSAGSKKGASAVPSLGGRIRISKRIDGSEGIPGVAVGALVVVGDYAGHDLDGEGRIESFIINHIRPVYGPRYGQRPTVYNVDRLDNLGNPIPGATLMVPVMPSSAPEAFPSGPPPAGAVATGPQQPAVAPSGITGDRFFDYLIMEQKRREEEANKRIEEIRAQATAKGMDPTMLMLLIDRAKPEPLDPQKLIAEAKRQGLIGRPPREDAPPPPPPPTPGGPLGGMPDPFGMPPEPPRPDPGIEALTVVLKQQGEMIASLMGRMMQPAPQQPQMDLASLITLAKSLAPAPPPESALSGQVMQALISRALAPPEKPKSIAETLKEIAALNEAKELLGGSGEDRPPSFGEVVAAAIENAPAIGQAVATVLGSIPRAPTLPTGPAGAPQAAAPHQSAPPPARTPAAPIPRPAAEAFLALKLAEGEQEIVNHIFNILTAYVQSGAEPWPRAANKLVDDFKKCDTRTEIRAVVTNLYVWSGAKKHMTDQIVERITDTLHKHYTMIHSQLAAGEPEKVLKDAGGVPPEATAAAQAADAAAEQGEAPVYEEQPGGDVVGATTVQ